MKVFISWSGEVSHKVAKALRDWLPSVIQSIDPYVSSEDIDKGARWSSDIASELDQSSFGILCVTKDNVSAPWLNFEAGALGKSIDKSLVCPFLFKIKRSEVEGPILQYQSTIYEKEDAYKLLKSINDACDGDSIEESRLETAFDVWWPRLSSDLDKIVIPEESNVEEATVENPKDAYISNVLEDVLEISRTNQRLLRDPESLLPPKYIRYILQEVQHINKLKVDDDLSKDIPLGAIEEIIRTYRDVLRFASRMRQSSEIERGDFMELLHKIERLDRPLRYTANKVRMRLPRDLFDDNI